MATHSSILAWTEEPGGLQSMGLQRVRHTYHTHTHKHIHTHTHTHTHVYSHPPTLLRKNFHPTGKLFYICVCVCVFVKQQNDSYFSNLFIMNHFK